MAGHDVHVLSAPLLKRRLASGPKKLFPEPVPILMNMGIMPMGVKEKGDGVPHR
jgi:hypothetical protein